MSLAPPRSGGGKPFTTPFGIEQLHRALIRCRKAGIDPWLVDLAILFGFPEAIDELAAALLSRQCKGRLGKDLGRYLSGRLLRRCQDRDGSPPAALVELVTLLLEVDKFAADQLQNLGALARATQYYREHSWASDREIARHAAVSARRIAAWRASGTQASGPLHALYGEG